MKYRESRLHTVQSHSELTDEIQRKLLDVLGPQIQHCEVTLHACFRIVREVVKSHEYTYERDTVNLIVSAASNILAGYYEIALDQLRRATQQIEEAHRIKLGVYRGIIRPGRKGDVSSKTRRLSLDWEGADQF